MIIINDYWLERPKPDDSDFYFDHKYAYFILEKPPESELTQPPEGTEEMNYPQYNYHDYMPAQKQPWYVRTCFTHIILLSVFGALFNFFLLLISSNHLFFGGVLFGFVGLLFSVFAFIMAGYFKKSEHLNLVLTVITIYFIFIILEIIIVPIIITEIGINPIMVFIFFTPILILAILTLLFTILSKNYLTSKTVQQRDIVAESIESEPLKAY
ncbi:MAG: hypothetical protein KAJ51_01570 [Thermoplasmata archaeon]|nr:hypothetical protein [Thermoplasmata archaeon]